MEVTNKYVTVKTHIDGSSPQESDFELKTAALNLSVEPGSKDVIVKNLYVSIDPYQINRMKRVCSSQKLVSTADGITPGQVSSSGCKSFLDFSLRFGLTWLTNYFRSRLDKNSLWFYSLNISYYFSIKAKKTNFYFSMM